MCSSEIEKKCSRYKRRCHIRVRQSLQTKLRVSAASLGMQFAPTVGMGWGQAEPGLWGLGLGASGPGVPTWEGVGDSWNSFAQCVVWVPSRTPSCRLDPAVLQGGRLRFPHRSPSLLSRNCNPIGRCQGAGGRHAGGRGRLEPAGSSQEQQPASQGGPLGRVVVVMWVVVLGGLTQLRVLWRQAVLGVVDLARQPVHCHAPL